MVWTNSLLQFELQKFMPLLSTSSCSTYSFLFVGYKREQILFSSPKRTKRSLSSLRTILSLIPEEKSIANALPETNFCSQRQCSLRNKLFVGYKREPILFSSPKRTKRSQSSLRTNFCSQRFDIN
jgi:hypothetical protein